MGIITGIQNVVQNWDNIDGSFVKFNQYLAVGIVAGSTGAALAEYGAGAAGVGMASGWLLNSGNAYIQGARGNEFVTAGIQGALGGGISGFAMEGLGAGFGKLMDMPWATDYHRANGGYHEVSFGAWLFGPQSGNISNIVAEQGIENAEVILASFSLSTKIDIIDYRTVPSYLGSGGVYFKFGIRGNCSQYNIVQTINTNDGGPSPRWDGDGSDSGRGFLRGQEHLYKYEGYKWGFEDGPLEPLNKDVSWNAEVTIVGKYRGVWRPITTISWGFNIKSGKVIRIPWEIVKNPSHFHSTWVKKACSIHSRLLL